MIAGRRAIRVIAIVIFFLAPWAAGAQKSKTQLQNEKTRNLEKIRETERILEETTQQKKASLGELSALNQRIRQQEALMRAIVDEIRLLDEDIRENSDLIASMEADLGRLKAEYRRLLQAAQTSSGQIHELLFLLAAPTFDQLVMRLRYFEQYATLRQDQANAIRRMQATLGKQVQQTEAIKNNKSRLLAEEESENNRLLQLKNQQRTLVRDLQKEEKRLRRELEDTRRAVARLDRQIEEIIREEMARAEREARERAAKKAPAARTEESLALSASFEENRARLPWPASGFVSQHFGRQNHPVLRGIVIQNDGINIQTKRDEKVKCVFNGKVTRVAVTEGIGKSVIVNHGDYFTVYAGLREVYVTPGQNVNTQQEIGLLNTNFEGFSELRFRIYKSSQPLDPQLWLSGSR
jgi:septal ring factor EnvC (AmiA/AmiB activator)